MSEAWYRPEIRMRRSRPFRQVRATNRPGLRKLEVADREIREERLTGISDVHPPMPYRTPGGPG